MSVTIHLPDAGLQIGDWREKLLPLLEESVHALGGFFVVDRLDILAYPYFYVIPELGVTGYAEGPHLLHIKLDALRCSNGNARPVMRSRGLLPIFFATQAI